MEDRDSVELYWQRSDRAVQESEKKYGPWCRTIAQNIVADLRDAEECVSDTWLAAWNAMPDKRPERLSPFLARITRNFALTRVVRRRAKKRGGGEVALALEELDECLAADCDLEKELEDRELSRVIDAFIGQLGEEEQIGRASCRERVCSWV